MASLLQKFKMHGVKRMMYFAQIEGRAKVYRRLSGSYSQSQEDLVIDRLLGKPKTGFYVEIGAADGIKYSNTYYFYRKGWTGINVEPDPDNFSQLLGNRPRDINLNLGISQTPNPLTLYRFSPGVMSTFSAFVANEFRTIGYEYRDQQTIATDTLANVLDRCAGGKTIDFISIDTEGYDFLALISNNWTKYRPKIMCVELEHLHPQEGQTGENAMHDYLTKLNYRLRFDNHINRIYQQMTP